MLIHVRVISRVVRVDRLPNTLKFHASAHVAQENLYVEGSKSGQRERDNANTFQLTGYGRMDLMLGYARRVGPSRVSVRLNVENLLDKKYFVISNNRNNVMPGPCRWGDSVRKLFEAVMAKRTLFFVFLTAVCVARPLFAQDEEVRLPALDVLG